MKSLHISTFDIWHQNWLAEGIADGDGEVRLFDSDGLRRLAWMIKDIQRLSTVTIDQLFHICPSSSFLFVIASDFFKQAEAEEPAEEEGQRRCSAYVIWVAIFLDAEK